MSKEKTKTKTNTPIPQELVNLLEQIDNEWKQAERPVTKSQEIKRYDLEQGNDPLGDYRDYVEFEDNTAAVAKKDDEIAALCAQPKDKQSITVLLGKIKRYDMEDGDFDASGGVICAYLVESKFGEWVRYTDVVELLNHLKLLSEHIIQLPNGKYQLRSKKKNKQGKTKNLGTFNSRGAAEKHEQEVQYFKHANESVSPRRHECPAPLNLKQDRSGRHPCASAEFGKHCQCYHRGGICCQCDSKFKPAIKESESLKKKVGTFKSRASEPFRKQYSLYGHTSYSNSTQRIDVNKRHYGAKHYQYDVWLSSRSLNRPADETGKRVFLGTSNYHDRSLTLDDLKKEVANFLKSKFAITDFLDSNKGEAQPKIKRRSREQKYRDNYVQYD